MVGTMAFTQADVDALDAAIKSGELSVRFRDREVTYRSLDDLIKARRYVGAKVAATPPGPRHQLADFSEANNT